MRTRAFMLWPLVSLTAASCGEPVAHQPVGERDATEINLASPLALTCTQHWVTAVSGSWDDASRWTPARVPTRTDTPCLDANGTYVVTLNRTDDPTTVSVAGLVVGGSTGHVELELTGNTVRLNAAQGVGVAAAGTLVLGASGGGSALLSSSANIDVGGELRTERRCPTCGNADVLRGNIRNAGMLTIGTTVLVDAPNALFLNTINGHVVIASGAFLIIPASAQSPTVNWKGGSLVGDGPFQVGAGRVTLFDGDLDTLANGVPQLQLEGASLTLSTPQSKTAWVGVRADTPGRVSITGSVGATTAVVVVADTVQASSEVSLVGDMTNAGLLRLEGTNDHSLRLAGTGLLTNAGRLLVDSAAALVHLAVNLTNTRVVTLEADLILDKANGLTTNSGEIRGSGAERVIVPGTSTFENQSSGRVSQATLEVRGGVLRGVGSFESVVNASGGVIEPGLPTGVLGTRFYAQDAASVLRLEVRGVGSSTFDQLTASDLITLDGRLEVITVAPFVGGVCGQAIDMLTAGAVTGSFASVVGAVAPDRAWRAAYLPGSVRLAGYDPTQWLDFTPQPTALDEGGAAMPYSLCLGQAPSASVTVTAGFGEGLLVVPSALTFTGATWGLPQQFAASALDDGIFEGTRQETFTHVAHSADARYEGLTESFKASVTDKQMPAAYTSIVNIAYGTASPLQRLDIYKPVTGTRFPVVLYIHGGNNPQGVVLKLAPIHAIDSGYAVVSVDYRKQSGQLLVSLQDVKSAIRFVRANAAAYGLDPSLMVAWGTSGGAQLSNLVAVTCGNPQFGTGGLSECVTAATSWFGITDLSRYKDDLAHLGCPPRQGRQSDSVTFSPLHYVLPGAALSPLRLEHGTQDCTVPYIQAVRMDSALVATDHLSSLALYLTGHGTGLPVWKADSVYSKTIGWIGRAFRSEL